jgi:tRNA(fMet)-specific endonuclease VapC
MKLLLDTDHCIYAFKQIGTVVEEMRKRSPDGIGVSVVTEAELRAGAAKSNAPLKALRVMELFLTPLTIFDFTSADAMAYAHIRATLERAGTPIGPLDIMIAAQAVACDLTLVTNNEREFRRVPGLRVENWRT